jgi:hypothetical protein
MPRCKPNDCAYEDQGFNRCPAGGCVELGATLKTVEDARNAGRRVLSVMGLAQARRPGQPQPGSDVPPGT